MVEDGAGGRAALKAWREGVEAFRLRERAGLRDVRGGSGDVGAGVLGLKGSSTMYMGVSKSRNSTHEH